QCHSLHSLNTHSHCLPLICLSPKQLYNVQHILDTLKEVPLMSSLVEDEGAISNAVCSDPFFNLGSAPLFRSSSTILSLLLKAAQCNAVSPPYDLLCEQHMNCNTELIYIHSFLH